MNINRLCDTFLELVRIPSPTFNERQVADHLLNRLKALGLSVAEDNTADSFGGTTGNIIAFLPANRHDLPRLFFTAHMDTVVHKGIIQPQRHNDSFISDGTTILGADDKAGIAPLLEALTTIQEQSLPHGDLQFIFTAAEEGGLYGASRLNEQLITADYGYCMDSSGAPGRLIICAPGEDEITIIMHGKAAHAGIAPEKGINAITIAAHAISSLVQGRISSDTTSNIGLIKGGTATNIVPDRTEIMAETRSLSPTNLATATRTLCTHFTNFSRNYNTCCSIKVQHCYEPYTLNSNSIVIAHALQAFERCHIAPQLTPSGGGSDANFFNRYLPCAVLGIGIRDAHTTNESIKIADLAATAQIVLSLISPAYHFSDRN